MSEEPFLLKGGGGGDFVPHPEGPVLAKCVDFVYLGVQDTPFGPKPLCQFVFVTEATMDDGRPFLIRSRRYTATINEKSNLSQFIEQWMGKRITPEARSQGFNPEMLIGRGVYLNVRHDPKKDGSGVWANIGSVMPAPSGATLPDAAEYIRVKDRPVEGEPGSPLQQQKKASAPATETAASTYDDFVLPDDSQDDLPF